MKLNKIMIVSLILLAVLTFGAVSATDNLTADETPDSVELGVSEADILVDEDGGDEIDDGNDGDDSQKIDCTITIDNPDIKANDRDGKIHVDVSENITGSLWYSIMDEDSEETYVYEWADVYEGSADLPAILPDLGRYCLEVGYNGDNVYNEATNSIQFTVDDYLIYIDGNRFVYGDSNPIYIIPPSSFNGVLTVNVNGREYEIVRDEDYYQYFLDSDYFAYGENNVTISYDGDEKFSAHSFNETVNVLSEVEWNTIITVGSDEVVASLRLPDDAAGVLTIYQAYGDNEDVFGSANVENGVASIALPDLKLGSYPNICAKFEGKYEILNDTSIYLSVIPIFNVPDVVIQGEDEFVSVEVPEGINGTLNVTYTTYDETDEYYENPIMQEVGFAVIENSMAKVSLANLNEGRYNLNVIFKTLNYTYSTYGSNYSGYGYEFPKTVYVLSDNDYELDIIKYMSDEVLVGCDYEQELEINVPEYLFANITVLLDEEVIETFVIDDPDADHWLFIDFYVYDLGIGKHNLTVNVTSDKFQNKTYIEEFEIVPAVIFIPQQVLVHEDFDIGEWAGQISVELNDDATGTIQVYIDGELFKEIEIEEGEPSYGFEFRGLSTEEHDVEVIYSGDDVYPEFSKTSVTNISYRIIVYSTYFIYGDDEVEIIVSPPYDLGDGELIATIDGIEYDLEASDDEFMVHPGDLSIGTHEMIVRYAGDDVFLESEFNTTVLIIAMPHIPSYWAADEDIHLILPSDAQGNLIFSIRTWDYDLEGYKSVIDKEIPLVDGRASYSLDNLTFGEYSIIASYSGDDYDVWDNENYFYMKANIYFDKYDDSLPIDGTKTVYIETPGLNGTLHVSIKKASGYEYDDVIDDYVTSFVEVNSADVDLVDYKAIYTISNLTLGEYYVEATFIFDGEQLPYESYDNMVFTVVPIDLYIPDPINLNGMEPVRVVMPEDCEGEVNVTVTRYYWDENDELVYEQIDSISQSFEDGEVNIDLPELDEGRYVIEVNITTANYGDYYTNLYVNAEYGDEYEGYEVEGVEFFDGNAMDNDVIVKIPKSSIEGLDEVVYAVFDAWDLKFEKMLNLSEVYSDDEFYFIRIADVTDDASAIEEREDRFRIEFFEDGNYRCYAEDEITIYNSPYFSQESSVLYENPVVALREIPEGADILSISVFKEGSLIANKTFNIADLRPVSEEWEDYEGDPVYEFTDTQLGITEEGEYNITVGFLKDSALVKSYSQMVNVSFVNILVCDNDEHDDDGNTIHRPFQFVDEEIFVIKVPENLTGYYVKIYKDGNQLGGNISISDLIYNDGWGWAAQARAVKLNDLDIDSSGNYSIRLEFYADDGTLFFNETNDIEVEIGDDIVKFYDSPYTSGFMDVIEFELAHPISSDDYFNVYLNGKLAGNITPFAFDKFSIDDEFHDCYYDISEHARFLKVGHYDVNITYVHDGIEEDFKTGEFNIIEGLNLTSDKDVYLREEDILISFNASEPTYGKLRPYHITGWGAMGYDDGHQIFNTISHDELKDVWEDGVFTINVGEYSDFSRGANYILIQYEVMDSEDDEEGFSYWGLIKINIEDVSIHVDTQKDYSTDENSADADNEFINVYAQNGRGYHVAVFSSNRIFFDKNLTDFENISLVEDDEEFEGYLKFTISPRDVDFLNGLDDGDRIRVGVYRTEGGYKWLDDADDYAVFFNDNSTFSLLEIPVICMFYGNLTSGETSDGMISFATNDFIKIEVPASADIHEMNVTVDFGDETRTYTLSDFNVNEPDPEDEEFDGYTYYMELTDDIKDLIRQHENETITYNFTYEFKGKTVSASFKRILKGEILSQVISISDLYYLFDFSIADDVLFDSEDEAVRIFCFDDNWHVAHNDWGGGYFKVYLDNNEVKTYELFSDLVHGDVIESPKYVSLSVSDLGISAGGIYNIKITHLPDSEDDIEVDEETGEIIVRPSYILAGENVLMNKDILVDFGDLVKNSTIELDNIEFNYGESGSANVTLDGASDIIANVVGHDEANITFENGVITVSGLGAGEYTLNVTTVPEEGYIAVSETVNVTVNKVDSSVSVGDLAFDYGANASATVDLTGADGISAVIVNSSVVPVVDGNKITVSGLNAGTYTLEVTSVPDVNHNAVTETAKITVNKVDSSVSVGDLAFDYDTIASTVVNVTGATGVTAKIVNSTVKPAVDGKKVTVSGLGAGTYTLEVTTVPDGNHNAVTGTATITVNKVDSEVSIDDLAFDYGGSASAVVNVTGATGVTAKIVNSTVKPAVDGNKVTVSGLAAGTYTLEVTTIPDVNHNAATATANVIVSEIDTVIVVNTAFSRYATDFYSDGSKDGVNGERGGFFYATLYDVNGNPLANKTVQIAINGPIYNVTTDSDGKAGLRVNLGKANTYTYALYFPGDEGYSASLIASSKLTVVEKPTSIIANSKYAFKPATKTKTVTVALNTIKNPYDNKLYLKAGKKLTLTVNGVTYSAKTDSKGVAKFNIKLTKAGTYKATVKFAGDSTYKSSSKSISISISKSAKSNAALKGVGVGTAPKALADPGALNIEGNYADYVANSNISTGNVGPAKKAAIIVVDKEFTRNATDFSGGERGGFFYAKLTDSNGNPLANKTVQIAVNGPIYNVTTDKDGKAGLRVNLAKANTYTYALSFAGDDEYCPAMIASSKLTVIKKPISIDVKGLSFKASAKTKTVTVTLKTIKNEFDGKTYLKDGKKVTLRVNGVTYSGSIKNGVVKFNVKLTKKGTYVAAVSFAGDSTYEPASQKVKIKIT